MKALCSLRCRPFLGLCCLHITHRRETPLCQPVPQVRHGYCCGEQTARYLFSLSQQEKGPTFPPNSHFLPAWHLQRNSLTPSQRKFSSGPWWMGKATRWQHDPTSSLCPLEQGWTLVDHIGSRCSNQILSPQNLQSAPLELWTEGIIKPGLA